MIRGSDSSLLSAKRTLLTGEAGGWFSLIVICREAYIFPKGCYNIGFPLIVNVFILLLIKNIHLPQLTMLLSTTQAPPFSKL
jgi:hypothetical protein